MLTRLLFLVVSVLRPGAGNPEETKEAVKSQEGRRLHSPEQTEAEPSESRAESDQSAVVVSKEVHSREAGMAWHGIAEPVGTATRLRQLGWRLSSAGGCSLCFRQSPTGQAKMGKREREPLGPATRKKAAWPSPTPFQASKKDRETNIPIR